MDLPPGTGDIQLTLVQTIPLSGAILITTPQEVAVVDAIKAANMFQMEQIGVPILGIVENMSWFEPDDAPGKRYYIFGEGGGQRLADKTQSSLLGQFPIKEKLRAMMDTGSSYRINPTLLPMLENLVHKLIQKVKLRDEIYHPTAQGPNPKTSSS